MESLTIDKALANQCVAFTGRGLSFERSQAESIVLSHGGRFSRSVTPHTTLLVIGAVGWPLQRNGRITKKVDSATRLKRQGHPLQIETEEDFLRRFGDSLNCHQHFSLPQLVRLVDVSPQQLISWRRLGLISPSHVTNELEYFDFKQLARLRVLRAAVHAGVKSTRLRRNFRQLKEFVSGSEQLLDNVVLYDSQLTFRNSSGDLYELNGQQVFEFEEVATSQAMLLSVAADLHFDEAVRRESVGDFLGAEQIYNELLSASPNDPDLLFNLANCLSEQQRFRESLRFYREAILHDALFSEAWNNLGNALTELNEFAEAVIAFRHALKIDPNFPSPAYGLGVCYDELGIPASACRYWKRYLKLEPDGECAAYALLRMRQLG